MLWKLLPLTSRLLFETQTINRSIHCSGCCLTRAWRREKGLPENKTAEGPLTDLPDFTYLDGRPTPLLHKQKQRVLKQRQFAEQIVQLSSEIDFAVEREKKLKEDAQKHREQIINNRLKAKGKNLEQK